MGDGQICTMQAARKTWRRGLKIELSRHRLKARPGVEPRLRKRQRSDSFRERDRVVQNFEQFHAKLASQTRLLRHCFRRAPVRDRRTFGHHPGRARDRIGEVEVGDAGTERRLVRGAAERSKLLTSAGSPGAICPIRIICGWAL